MTCRFKALLLTFSIPAILAGCALTGSESREERPTIESTALAMQLPGIWLEPIPGMPGRTQGMRLFADGRAESVNMATLPLTAWKLEGRTLILTGESVGNGQPLPFREAWEVLEVSNTRLVLRQADLTRELRRTNAP